MPTPGGPTKQRIGLRSFSFASWRTAMYSRMRSLTFGKPVVVLVEHARGVLEVELVDRRVLPRHGHEPLEVAADDADFRRGGRHLLEPP